MLPAVHIDKLRAGGTSYVGRNGLGEMSVGELSGEYVQGGNVLYPI